MKFDKKEQYVILLVNQNELPIFNKLYNFFDKKESEFEIEFNDLVNIK